jgi:hypothetical protein
VSSFVVKPILSSMLRIEDNFSKAAYIYCLMANCLQFRKEIVDNPTKMGALGTRALLCELLAIKLLKEFSTRELVRPHSVVDLSQSSSSGVRSLDRRLEL